MCIENTLIDLSVESKGLSKAERLSLKLIAKEVKKLKAKNGKLKIKNEALRDVVRLYRQDEMSAEEENLKNTKPCPYNKEVDCVQYPEDSCGCDPCEECETKLKVAEDLARRFHETYERLAPDFGYETRRASAKPWKDVPEDNKQLMIAVCKEILPAYSVAKQKQKPTKNIEKIKIALSDPKAPWYGSDLVGWVADLIEKHEALLKQIQQPEEQEMPDGKCRSS